MDAEVDVDAGHCQSHGHRQVVLQQDVVGPDDDQDRRQTPDVGIGR